MSKKNISANAIGDDNLENVSGGWSWDNSAKTLSDLSSGDISTLKKNGYTQKYDIDYSSGARSGIIHANRVSLGYFDANGNKATDQDLYNVLDSQN